MTNQEAIKILSELHDQCCQADSIFCTDVTGARCEAVDMAISALEKQIPKELGSKALDYLGRVRHECGNCGEVIEGAMWDYCPWCGQRIGGE